MQILLAIFGETKVKEVKVRKALAVNFFVHGKLELNVLNYRGRKGACDKKIEYFSRSPRSWNKLIVSRE